jgi:formylglycine-generating enzyme required for sulfatase activity
MHLRILLISLPLLACALPLHAQQKQKQLEQQAKSKPAAQSKPKAPANAGKKTLKILANADCIVKVDSEVRTQCKAGVVGRIYLPEGQFLLEIISTADNKVKDSRIFSVTDTREQLLEIELTGVPVVASEASTAPNPTAGSRIIDPLAGTFILVKGGAFTMGCTSEQSDCVFDEKPTHPVTLSNFYIGETEVTQAQWRTVMGSDPSELNNKGCDQCPVEKVSWDDIQDFLSRLNSRSGGARYRMPTEAEWEYAARGGSQSRGFPYAGSNNLDEVAWYYNNSGDRNLSGNWDYEHLKANNCKTHPVKGKKANELGLYDMSGNVFEWCQDWYGDYTSGSQFNPTGPASGSFRVLRGGSWLDGPTGCRVARRNYFTPGSRLSSIGFRLARTP